MNHDPVNRKLSICLLYAVVAMFLSPGLNLAQDAPARWNDMREIHVKPGRTGEFENLVTQYNAARVASGQSAVSIFQGVLDEIHTYYFLTSLPSLSPYDKPQPQVMAPDAMARWIDRIEDCQVSQRRFVTESYPDLANFPQQGAGPATPANTSVTWMLYTKRVLPGRAQEYQNWVRDDLLPALRKAGMVHIFSRTAFGGDPNEYTHAHPNITWSMLDQGMMLKSVDEKELQRLISKGDALIESSTITLVRSRPDLMTQ